MSYTSPIIPSGDDQRFIDIDFRAESNEYGFARGMNPDTENDLAGWREFESVETMIPRAQWPDLIAAIDSGGGHLERRIRKIYNQGNEGSCVYNSLAQCACVVWNKQFGDAAWIELSPISGYRWNAPGPGSGSNVGSSVTWLAAKGLLPTNSDVNKVLVSRGLFQHTHPNTGYSVRPATGWEATARLFRADEWLRITTFEGWFTALFRGYPCSGGRDGHCICHVRPVVDGGSFLSMYANSWGSWGTTREISPLSGSAKGFGFDTENKVRTMVGRGAFCVRSMLVPPWELEKEL